MKNADQAIERIHALVLRGDLKPGSRLPAEPAFSEALGVSRNAYREAVKALEVAGVLAIRQGDGTYVSNLSGEDLGKSLSMVLALHQAESPIELLEIRRILESAAAAKAAAIASDVDVEGLRTVMSNVDGGATVGELLEHDLEFHHLLVQACANPYLSALTDALATRTLNAREQRARLQPGALERMRSEHEGIVNAIARREPQLAAALSSAHINGVEEWVRDNPPPWAEAFHERP